VPAGRPKACHRSAIIGKALDEATIMRIAHAFEQSTAWHTLRSPVAFATHDRIRVVIGLECHVQLATESQDFCGCSPDYAVATNTHVVRSASACPVYWPVINKKAVEYTLKTGIGPSTPTSPKRPSSIARTTPTRDLVKGYQFAVTTCRW